MFPDSTCVTFLWSKVMWADGFAAIWEGGRSWSRLLQNVRTDAVSRGNSEANAKRNFAVIRFRKYKDP